MGSNELTKFYQKKQREAIEKVQPRYQNISEEEKEYKHHIMFL